MDLSLLVSHEVHLLLSQAFKRMNLIDFSHFKIHFLGLMIKALLPKRFKLIMLSLRVRRLLWAFFHLTVLGFQGLILVEADLVLVETLETVYILLRIIDSYKTFRLFTLLLLDNLLLKDIALTFRFPARGA